MLLVVSQRKLFASASPHSVRDHEPETPARSGIRLAGAGLNTVPQGISINQKARYLHEMPGFIRFATQVAIYPERVTQHSLGSPHRNAPPFGVHRDPMRFNPERVSQHSLGSPHHGAPQEVDGIRYEPQRGFHNAVYGRHTNVVRERCVSRVEPRRGSGRFGRPTWGARYHGDPRLCCATPLGSIAMMRAGTITMMRPLGGQSRSDAIQPGTGFTTQPGVDASRRTPGG